MQCSKEWFKKEIKDEGVMRDRYWPILTKYRDNENYMMKIKIKTPGPGSRMIPTALHLRKESGEYVKDGATLDDINSGAMVSAIVSMSYGIHIAGTGNFGVSIWADELIVRPGKGELPDLSHFCSSVPLPMVNAATETGAAVNGVQGLKRDMEDDEDSYPTEKKQKACEDGEDLAVECTEVELVGS